MQNHPIIGRLLHIKTLMEKLRPLDQKLQYQIDKMLRTAAMAEVQVEQAANDPLQYRPNVESMAVDEQ